MASPQDIQPVYRKDVEQFVTMYGFPYKPYYDLQCRGFDPKYVIDIGANKGEWAVPFRSIFPTTNIYSIEANPLCQSELAYRGCTFVIALLGKTTGDAKKFYISSQRPHDTGASMYKEIQYTQEETKVIEMVTTRLDDLVLTPSAIDLIKVDVQGAELDVLEGALQTLAKTSFVLLEISLVPYNEGAPLLPEVVAWMDQHNFRVYEHLSTARHKGTPIQMDFLFVRKDHPLSLTNY